MSKKVPYQKNTLSRSLKSALPCLKKTRYQKKQASSRI